MIEEILALLGLLIENCTGVIIVEKVPSNTREGDQDEDLLIQAVERSLEDFTKFDPNDSIFREYDPPENEEEDPHSWKKNLPSFRNSVWESFKFVFLIQTFSGTAIGFLVIFIAFLDFNSADLCYDKTGNWDKLPHTIASIRITGQAIEGFIIQMWDYLLLSAVFPWQVIKELNLLTLNLLAAFIDMTYRLFLQLFGVYKIWWMSYPLNALFTFMTIINSLILARHFKPRPISCKKVCALAFSFSAQFILGMSANIFLVYKLLPWYNEQVENTKVVVAALCPLLTALPKVVSRIAAQNLEEVHPGTAHVFVGMLYGSTAIVFRTMQAELSTFQLFIALGIGHAVVDLLERLTITMRDFIWEYLYKVIRCLRRPTSKYRSPRSRRFIADVTIQIMLQEATGLVAALGFIQLYHFMYSDNKPSYSDYEVLLQFLIRSLTGLVIDLFFNVISVLIQTRYMNVAVTRVWKQNWRYHLVVNIIISAITTIYFTEYLIGVVRDKYDYGSHKAVRFAWNCSMPFKSL